jgi:dihydrofolate reductase
MKVILSMSMSLNGIVARENNSTDFLNHGEWPLFVELARQSGALVWGRKTHEIVRSYGEQVLHGFDGLVRIVMSHDPNLLLEPGWQVATSPQQALAHLGAANQTQAVLAGGASVNTAFACAGLINEAIFNIGSVIAGCGVPLFSPETFDLPLQLIEMKQAGEEIVQLRYAVRQEV